MVGGGTTGRLTHVQLTPDPENGLLYVTACKKDAYGAQKLDFQGPERTARVSLNLGLLQFDLENVEGRLRDFEVIERGIRPGQTAVALNVRTSTTRPGRAPKAEAASGQQEQA